MCVYDKNKDKIDSLILKIQSEKNKKERRKLIDSLNDFTVSVNHYDVYNKDFIRLYVNKYMEIYVYEGFDYDNMIGLKKIKTDDKNSSFNENIQVF